MKCEKCAKNLIGLEYRQVAKWAFCLECFQQLMDQAEEKQQQEAGDRPEGEILGAEPVQQYCRLCEGSIANDNCRELLGLLFCKACYMNLIKRPVMKIRSELDQQNRPLVTQESVDLTKLVRCHACNRKIPELGSKEFNGKLFCPDCYNALPELKALRPKLFPQACAEPELETLNAEKTLEPGLHCQACLRELSAENLDSVEGFDICRACLTTDSAAAIEIARARHRKRLAEMKKRLEN